MRAARQTGRCGPGACAASKQCSGKCRVFCLLSSCPGSPSAPVVFCPDAAVEPASTAGAACRSVTSIQSRSRVHAHPTATSAAHEALEPRVGGQDRAAAVRRLHSARLIATVVVALRVNCAHRRSRRRRVALRDHDGEAPPELLTCAAGQATQGVPCSAAGSWPLLRRGGGMPLFGRAGRWGVPADLTTRSYPAKSQPTRQIPGSSAATGRGARSGRAEKGRELLQPPHIHIKPRCTRSAWPRRTIASAANGPWLDSQPPNSGPVACSLWSAYQALRSRWIPLLPSQRLRHCWVVGFA